MEVHNENVNCYCSEQGDPNTNKPKNMILCIFKEYCYSLHDSLVSICMH